MPTEPGEANSGPASAFDTQELLRTAKMRLLGNYRPAPMVLDYGRGCEVYDTDGHRYLDFAGGIAVCCLGHGHAELAGAIAQQAGRLMQASNYFYNLENVQLAHELCAITGFERAFFCNSGSEAVEASIKLARRHFFAQGQPQRQRFIAFQHSFHGRTIGALSLTGNPAYREGLGTLLQGVTHVPYGELGAVADVMGPDVAAIVAEPIQGEGGVRVPPQGFLAGLRRLADDHGALLLLDEIQTGVGRTGAWLAADHDDVRADATTIAKGLGGGFPIGALLLREHLAASLPAGTHGSTFGGNALASAAARLVLRVLERDGLLEAARSQGATLARGLTTIAQKHEKMCAGSRGRGLLQALLLRPEHRARDLLGTLREHGILATAAGPHALRFTPPLIVASAEIDEAVGRIDTALAHCGR